MKKVFTDYNYCSPFSWVVSVIITSQVVVQVRTGGRIQNAISLLSISAYKVYYDKVQFFCFAPHHRYLRRKKKAFTECSLQRERERERERDFRNLIIRTIIVVFSECLIL